MSTQLLVDQVLRLTRHELVHFVQQNIIREDDTWNISNFVDWEHVSQTNRDLLAAKLPPAAQQTIEPSVDAAELATLLAQIPSDRGPPIRHTTTQYPSPSRSSTVEPPENEIQEYETRCHQALLDDGCRPLFPISLLPQVSTNADAYRDLLRPWTRYPGTSDPEDWQVFSRQLRRWKEFRKWQLGNRRQTVGFAEFLEEQQREFERLGMADGSTARPDFVQAVCSQWDDEYGHGQQQPDNGDDAEAVLSRAEAAGPMDDVYEYLAFEYFWLGRLAKSAQKLRLQHDAEWEGLVEARVVNPLNANDDVASTEVEDMRDRELERAARAARSLTAKTSATATKMTAIDTAKDTRIQTARNPSTVRGQKPRSRAQESL